MKQKVILISGKKQSGKSSLRNYLAGRYLVDAGRLSTFNISTKGELLVPTFIDNQEVLRALDLSQYNEQFYEYAKQFIWPYVKNYSIADPLKKICIDLFDLDYDQCYGTDNDKNTPSHIRWEDVSFALPPRRVGLIRSNNEMSHFLSAREVMQEFGQLMRKIKSKVWVEKTKKDIINNKHSLNIVDDVRFPNEIDLLYDKEQFDVFSVRLLRNIHNSSSEGEIELDGYTNFDLILPDMPMIEVFETVHDAIKDKWWF